MSGRMWNQPPYSVNAIIWYGKNQTMENDGWFHSKWMPAYGLLIVIHNKGLVGARMCVDSICKHAWNKTEKPNG